MDLCQLLPAQFTKTINLSQKQINRISKIQSQFINIQHLHLSHNQFVKLDGFEQFQNLKSLSLANNLIQDINELRKVNKNLLYLTIHSNPLHVYDYNDVCYNIFPKLKRLDGMSVDVTLIKSQRIYAEQVSRWLIPWIQKVKMHISQISNVLRLRNTANEINQSEKFIYVGLIDWKEINKYLEFLHQPNLINLAKLVQEKYTQELDQTAVRELKKTHYDTFLDFVKLQTSNHFTSFIDYLILINNQETNYYKTFLEIQKPQLHISSDLYPLQDEIIHQVPEKIEMQVPTFLQDKIKCPDVISNTYRKERQIQIYEQCKFVQYFPVFPFRTEYVQGIVQLVVQQLEELKNLVQQLAYFQQSAPTTLRTLRRRPKPVKNSPAPQQLTQKPEKLEPTPREINVIEENSKKPYGEVKKDIIMSQKINKLFKSLHQIFKRRLQRHLGRLQNPSQENTVFLDYPQLVRLQTIFYSFRKALERQKIKRKRLQDKKLMAVAFTGLRLFKKAKQVELMKINKGYQILQKLYFKNLIDGIRSLRVIKQQKKNKPKVFKLILNEIPHIPSKETLKFKNYNDENNENMKLCSVCTYQFQQQ